uniref:Uncharacterized protein n=1 Tax=Sphaerodactylus townsendi TaxID=933632 RepID=A0ACB8FGH5_9SAUR
MLGSNPEKECLFRGADHSEKEPPSLSNNEVERCRTLFSETVTLAGEEIQELRSKDNRMEEDSSQGESELEEEPLMCKDLKTPSVQFFEDDEDDDDTKDVDVLTVKRRNVFGLKPTVALVKKWVTLEMYLEWYISSLLLVGLPPQSAHTFPPLLVLATPFPSLFLSGYLPF